MGKKRMITLTAALLATSVSLASCGKEGTSEELVVGLSENVLEWCAKHEADPEGFGVS